MSEGADEHEDAVGWQAINEGRSPRFNFFVFILKPPSVFITERAFRVNMGREIVTISVPIGSDVWHQIKAWREDEKANVSANVCAAVKENMEGINKLNSLQKRHEWLGDELKTLNPECGCRGLEFEKWLFFFGSDDDE